MVSLRPNTVNFISLILKNNCHIWTVRPLDNEKFRVLQSFSTKLILYVCLASVFMSFYLLLHSVVRAYKMHAFRMWHFVMSHCVMMHSLMTTMHDAVLHCIMLQWIIMCYTILNFMMLHCIRWYTVKCGDPMITKRLLSFGRSQQTQDSLNEIDRIQISKRCNYVRINSACRVLLQSRFSRHTYAPSTWNLVGPNIIEM